MGGACLLEKNDAQCGTIYYGNCTRLLKFYCTFCRETYDNINYFCEHLSGHISGQPTTNAEIANDDELPLPKEPEYAETDGHIHSDDLLKSENDEEEEFIAEERAEIESVLEADDDFENFNGDEMIVEELDEEAAEIAAEVEAEMYQATLVSEEDGLVEQQNDGEELLDYVESKDINAPGNQNLNDTSCAELSTVAQGRVRKKKVTTVKVIAVRNRIAELYQRIKYEEEQRLRGEIDPGCISEESEQMTKPLPDTETTTDETNNAEDEEAMMASSSTQHNQCKEPQRTIIGETVITLLPEGSSSSCSAISAPPVVPAPTQPHFYSRGSTNEKDCICPACGKRFRSSFSLTIHKRTHYLESASSVKLAHKCSDCDRLFNRISELKEHVQAVHYPEGFVCPVCQRRLTSLTLLEMHMRKVHLARPFSCKLCSKNFDTRDAFDVHHDNVHRKDVGGDLLPIRCHICGRRYSTDGALQHHMRNHKAQEPQCCVVCGKMTLRITQHMKIHTPRPKRILSCSVCDKVFNFSSGLSQHFKIMHKYPRPLPKRESDATERKRKPRPSRSKKKQVDLKENGQVSVADATPELKLEQQQSQDVNEKEEEAKRVIVEFIQSVTYNSVADVDDGALPADVYYSHQLLETAPPIAREEIITAVNSIVGD